MSKFSERMGILPIKSALQMDGMTDALRNSLWNVLDANLWSDTEFRYSDVGDRRLGDVVSRAIWTDFFKAPADVRPYHGYDIVKKIRDWFFRASWNEVYDFVEYMLDLLSDRKISVAINSMLERELAGFRYIEGCFIPVTSEEEVRALVEAMAAGPFEGVSAHLRSAAEHLSRKQDPDYRNSIKESISAIESMAREVSGNDKATLGEALAAMERKGRFHPALRKSLAALYGYASDEGGIRHAMLEEPNLTVSDAKFMLVACAAFVNYMKSKI